MTPICIICNKPMIFYNSNNDSFVCDNDKRYRVSFISPGVKFIESIITNKFDIIAFHTNSEFFWKDIRNINSAYTKVINMKITIDKNIDKYVNNS